MKLLSALVVGLIFGVGLGLSAMTNPAKVVGFLDVFGDWDITLVFVIGGSILVHLPTRRWVLGRGMSDPGPKSWNLDPKLLFGSALFGVGWAMSGWCPGPAVASIATLSPDFLLFFVAMSAGMIVWQEVQTWRDRRATTAAERGASTAPNRS